MLPYNIDHVAIAVRDLDATLESLQKLFGVEAVSREVVIDQGVEEAMVPLGGTALQLLGATGPDTPVGRFLEKRGEGLHHISVAVADLDAALEHLRAAGARLIDETPQDGGGGARIAFVHPATVAGTLIELVEFDG
jgi:methylmalonyl-CoA/ethylmalonyl-CoA epimerase